MIRFLLILFFAIFSIIPASAKQQYSGPYKAVVTKITDADTIKVKVDIWPQTYVDVSVRLRGIDTPEKFRPKCDYEKGLAKLAVDFVKEYVALGDTVQVTNIENGKYANRVAAVIMVTKDDVELNLNQMLLDSGHAVMYNGKGKRISWCP